MTLALAGRTPSVAGLRPLAYLPKCGELRVGSGPDPRELTVGATRRALVARGPGSSSQSQEGRAATRSSLERPLERPLRLDGTLHTQEKLAAELSGMTYQATIIEHQVDWRPFVVWAFIAAMVLTFVIWAQAQIGNIDPNQGPSCDQTSGLLTQTATPSNILPPCVENPLDVG